MRRRKLIVSGLSAIVTVASLWFSWNHYFAAPSFNSGLHQQVGIVLAEGLLRSLRSPSEILVITLEEQDSPLVATQFAAFRATLAKQSGVRIGKVVALDGDQKAQYGPGRGLSANKLTREIKKLPQVSAVVSFVGLPALQASDLATNGVAMPPLFGLCRDRTKLISLLENKVLQVAIVPRFQFPAPGPETPGVPREWFDRQFQVITPTEK